MARLSVPRDPRSSWTRREVNVAWQGRDERRGIAVHWPGGAVDVRDHAACLDLVDSYELYHLSGEWGAIAYNQLACPHGRLIAGRGPARRSGANGADEPNRRWGSVCVLVGPGDKPTPGQLDAILVALADQAPGGRLATHAQVRPEPTACPGPWLTRWVESGAWRTHARQRKDDDPVTPEEIERIAHATARAVWDADRIGVPDQFRDKDNPRWRAALGLRGAWQQSADAAAASRVTLRLVRKLVDREGVDVDELADELVPELVAALGPDDLAAALADALPAYRLVRVDEDGAP